MTEARDLLPPWVGWMPLVSYTASAFLLSWIAARVATGAALGPLRRHDGLFWLDRARLAYPARAAGGATALLLLVLFGGLAGLTVGPMSRVPPTLAVAASAIAAYLAVADVAGRAEHEILAGRSRTGRWKRFAGAWLAEAPHWVVGAVIAILMPATMTARAWLVLAAGFVALYRAANGDGLRLAGRFGLIRPASARLRAIVARVSERMGCEPVPAWEWPSVHANAFLWPTPPRLVFTDRILDLLDDDELAAVCAHEMGHATESPELLAARTASTVWILPLAAARPLIGSLGAGPYVIFLALTFLPALFARKRPDPLEERADEVARRFEGPPGAYARALAKMHEADLVPVVFPAPGGSHPDPYDRLIVAGTPLPYPRPEPPSRVRGWIAAVLALAVAALGALGAHLAAAELRHTERNETLLLWSVALTGGDGEALRGLASIRAAAGEDGAAVALYRAAWQLGPLPPRHLAELALVLSRRGECRAARETLSALEETLAGSGSSTNDERAGFDRAHAEAVDAAARCRGPRESGP